MNKEFHSMEKICQFFSPKKIVINKNIVNKVGEEVQTLGGKKAIIVTDPGIVSAGFTETVEKSLHEQKIKFDIFDKVVPEPPAHLVDECGALIREGSHDIVIGLGGGSSLDVAKGAAIMATNPGAILDYVGIDLVPNAALPKILIPTTAGTGSEVTKSLIVADERENTKKSVSSYFALSEVAMLDPMLTLTMPPEVTANTGMDALVHAIEAYVAATTTPFAQILAIEAISLIGYNLPMSYSKGNNETARYNMLLAAALAGLAFASGRLGAVHALSYIIGTDYHLSHGRSNAIMLPHVMNFNKTGNLAKFADIAQALGENIAGLSMYEAADKSVESIKKLLDSVQIPYRLTQYGISQKDLPKLVEGGMKQARLFITNPRDLTEEDVTGIYKGAF